MFDNSNSEEENEAVLIPNQVEIINPILTVDPQYRNRYISRMQQNADVHYHSRISFNPGDLVLLKKDVDNNVQTKKREMDDFYEEETWEILERVGANNFKIKKQGDQPSVTVVCKNRLKKINF